MTQGDVRAPAWTPAGPPFSSYEASDGQPDGNAQVRSVDRTLAGGRRCRGQLIAQRLSTRGYPQVNLVSDDGRRVTIEVHAVVMMAHEGACPPGMQVRHFNDVSTDNRWAPGGEAACGPGKPGNLVYGDAKRNRADQLRNTPPAPRRPPRLCGCGQPVTQGSSKRCHDCVARMGADAAVLLAHGMSPRGAAAELDYPSPDGLVRLAARYGGYVPSPPRRSQRVTTTVRRWLRLGDRT